MTSTLGPYQLRRELSRGGQGVVFEARHEGTGAQVALKVLLDSTPSVVRRFRQEGQVLARLNHPYVVRALDQGEIGGRHYMAMEFVEGADLGAVIKTGGLPELPWIVDVLGKIAEALDGIHYSGLVHRDLKPANVVIESATGRPVLVDFGLVQRDAEEFGALSQDRLSKLSVTGEIKGTPGYMAPEQADPCFGEVGPRADVYALGAVLFYLLTGSAPYRGVTFLNVLSKLTSDDPPPSARDLVPQVPEAVAAVCQRAMCKRPEGRPATAPAFVMELAEVVETLEVATPPARTLRRAAMAAGLVAVLAAPALWFAIPSPKAPPEGAVAPAPEIAPVSETGAQLFARAQSLAANERHAEAAPLLERAAQAGHVEAMHTWAVALYMGRGVVEDRRQAVEWYERAAKEGWVPSMKSLGAVARAGSVGPVDQARAVHWLGRAAEGGDLDCTVLLGIFYGNGEGVARDPERALALFRRAAEGHHERGMLALASSLLSGDAAPPDPQGAIPWFERAAAMGNTQAMWNLAVIYEEGVGVPPDLARAARWFREGATAGDPSAMIELAKALTEGLGVEKDPPAAARWLLRAAEAGDAEAMLKLARHYRHGVGVPKDDSSVARWLRKSAEAGNAKGMTLFALVLLEGRGVEADIAEGVRWLRKGAELGEHDAIFNLGHLYVSGVGVPQDDAMAVSWYRKGAELGDGDSMAQLGAALREGRGVAQDHAESVRWLRRSAEKGVPKGLYGLGVALASGKGVARDDALAEQWLLKAAEGRDPRIRRDALRSLELLRSRK